MITLNDLKIDPEFAVCLDGDQTQREAERADLLALILKDGAFMSDIIVWKGHGIIVDGQTRYGIWVNELNRSETIKPRIQEKEFASRQAVIDWMVMHQLSRRNWTPSQRAMHAALLRDRPDGQASPTIAEASEKCGVSKSLVKAATAVVRNGAEPLQEAVRSGVVSAVDAARIVDLPKPQQAQSVELVKSGEFRSVSSAAQSLAEAREPGDETEHESGPEVIQVETLVQRLAEHTSRVESTAAELFRALDTLKGKSPTFAREHRSFEDLMRNFGTFLRPLIAQSNRIKKLWSDVKGDIEEAE